VPVRWAKLKNFNVVVSIDGLPEEHNARRAPATYDRILKSLAGHDRFITVHCTLTGQIMKRPGYLEEFVKFWSDRPEVRKIWFSIFTPQRGDAMPEILTRAEREQAATEILRLRKLYPRLEMPEGLVKEFLKPPASPEECIFAQTTHTISADLKTRITPCQFGGDPDCSQCGCVASMALAAVGDHKVAGPLTAGQIFWISNAIGKRFEPVKERPAGLPNVVPTIAPAERQTEKAAAS
jgi:sulfatase maturation enzyme AslB (radical SAM superfamily)